MAKYFDYLKVGGATISQISRVWRYRYAYQSLLKHITSKDSLCLAGQQSLSVTLLSTVARLPAQILHSEQMMLFLLRRRGRAAWC
jgi:hypothetical protein